jgi:endonuclease/exonuclease/phosphatase family metal-dependent hydrolase
VWFGDHRFDQRRDALLAELERRQVDVIALQEVTEPLLQALRAAPWVRSHYQLCELEAPGYDVIILSRLTMRRMTSLPLPSEMGRRLLVAELACGLHVATVHLESTSECAENRAEQLRIIQPLLAATQDVVLVGDMNFAPEAILENQALDPSFVDVWPSLHPEPGYTIDTERNLMRRRTRAQVALRRIDRVFAHTRSWRPSAIELVGDTAIDSDGTFISDHFGLEVTMAVAIPRRVDGDPCDGA